ncbi:hypothetical protein P8452_43839 [Trifolium repens]|nr:hypothetical protein P8452_43839 [Trifolium repens]
MVNLHESPKSQLKVETSRHVSPQIYNDDKTHLFVHWKSNYTRGCTNLQCQSFVQTDKSVILNQPFNQTSTNDGLVVELQFP